MQHSKEDDSSHCVNSLRNAPGHARLGGVMLAAAVVGFACSDNGGATAKPDGTGGDDGAGGSAAGGGSTGGGSAMGGSGMVERGEDIFRNDTFGDEAFWTDTLRLHQVVQASVSPETALGVGLKVDADRLPEGILETADLTDPATTVALLELDAVVGLKGTVEDGNLVRLGISCALCHSTVDDSVMPGIGTRIDGPANRDLNPGAIIALSEAEAVADLKEMLNGWGAGFYDPYWNQDRPGEPEAVLIPPIYGLEDVSLETYTGEGPISYWNSYVGVTQMGGQGDFANAELGIDIDVENDLVTPKLEPLLAYQVSLMPPAPPVGSFDAEAASRGATLFEGLAQCSSCHGGDALGGTLHDPDEGGHDPNYAMRGTTGQYRATPLRALFDHPPYFHDGSAQTLMEVVDHYDDHLALGLTDDEKSDLIEYLKSL